MTKTPYSNCKLLIEKGRIENVVNSISLFALVGFITNDEFLELSTLYDTKKLELTPPEQIPEMLPEPPVEPETLPTKETTKPKPKPERLPITEGGVAIG